MLLRKIRKIFKREESDTVPWNVEAMDSLLAIFPTATEERPSRDGTCLNWESIVKVTAYKADLFVEDLLCLLFETIDGHAIEVNEDMLGFDEFLAALPKKLSKFPERDSWWGNIIENPFKENTTILWKR